MKVLNTCASASEQSLCHKVHTHDHFILLFQFQFSLMYTKTHNEILCQAKATICDCARAKGKESVLFAKVIKQTQTLETNASNLNKQRHGKFKSQRS